MSIDDQLLAAQNSSQSEAETSGSDGDGTGAEAAPVDDWRASRRQDAPAGPDGNQSQAGQDFSALRQAAKAQKQAVDQKSGASQSQADKIADAATAPIRKATGSCLRQSWLNLPNSCFTSLLYPNIHVFLRLVLGKKLFGSLGSEWIPEKPVSAVAGEKNNPLAENSGKAAALGEGAMLAGLDLGCLMILIAVSAILAAVIYFASSPTKIITYGLGWIWDLIKSFF